MNTCLLITTWNRSPQLLRSLERLGDDSANLTLPDEILVIDDGGDDGCDNTVRHIDEWLSIPVRYIYTHNPDLALCSHARNVGIKNTDCELVLISEPEMWFVTDVVKQTVERWHARQAERISDIVTAGIVYHAQEQHMTEYQQANRLEGWVAPYVGLYERQKLLDVGGWNEYDMPGPWGFDDIDLLTRVRIAGTGQFIDKEIEAFHQWHENPGRDQVGAEVNDVWWRVQNLDERYLTDPDVIIANKDRDWGIVKQR